MRTRFQARGWPDTRAFWSQNDRVVIAFSRPVTLLRLEGLVVGAVATYLFSLASGDWLLFALLALVPDVGMLGYFGGTRVGAATYNLLHTESLPVAVAAAAIAFQWPLVLSVALVWLAHIGLDRMLGYGLKLPYAFKETHLGRIGRGASPPADPYLR